jgi:histone H3/H4
LKEIKKHQASTEMLIQKRPFQQMVRDIGENITDEQLRWTTVAMQVLQIAA